MAWVLKNGQRFEVPDADVFGPAPTLAENKTAKLSDLANRRWQAETGGITVSGMFIPTDRETQDRVDQICSAYTDGDISGVVNFKAAGVFVQIDEATMRTIKAAGAQHIQACFAHEAVLSAEINAATTQAELDAVDINEGWPG